MVATALRLTDMNGKNHVPGTVTNLITAEMLSDLPMKPSAQNILWNLLHHPECKED
jgi:hypothetical protein